MVQKATDIYDTSWNLTKYNLEFCVLRTSLCNHQNACMLSGSVGSDHMGLPKKKKKFLCTWDVFQARILDWVAISSSRGSSQTRDPIQVSCISCTAGRFFTSEPLGFSEPSDWGPQNMTRQKCGSTPFGTKGPTKLLSILWEMIMTIMRRIPIKYDHLRNVYKSEHSLTKPTD